MRELLDTFGVYGAVLFETARQFAQNPLGLAAMVIWAAVAWVYFVMGLFWVAEVLVLLTQIAHRRLWLVRRGRAGLGGEAGAVTVVVIAAWIIIAGATARVLKTAGEVIYLSGLHGRVQDPPDDALNECVQITTITEPCGPQAPALRGVSEPPRRGKRGPLEGAW